MQGGDSSQTTGLALAVCRGVVGLSWTSIGIPEYGGGVCRVVSYSHEAKLHFTLNQYTVIRSSAHFGRELAPQFGREFTTGHSFLSEILPILFTLVCGLNNVANLILLLLHVHGPGLNHSHGPP